MNQKDIIKENNIIEKISGNYNIEEVIHIANGIVDDFCNKEFKDLKTIGLLESGRYLCLCSCGRYIAGGKYKISNWNLTSCGHAKRGMEMIGKHFGFWEVIGKSKEHGKYTCRCKCGTVKDILGYNLEHGISKSCGCARFRNDLTGRIYGTLEVIGWAGDGLWKCKCTSCSKEYDLTTYELTKEEPKKCDCQKIKQSFINLTGKHFGDWEVLDYQGNSYWRCRCNNCGNIKNVHSYELRTGGSRSCGCKTTTFKDLVGRRYGFLEPVAYLGKQRWKCFCHNCGGYTEENTSNLRNGSAKSCGCALREHYRNTMIQRYGDVGSSRINNPREEWQLETLNNENMLSAFIVNNIFEMGYLPSIKYISNLLDTGIESVRKKIKEYNLEDIIKNSKSSSYYEEEINCIFPCNNRNNRTVLDGKELDFYYEKERVAIEFNGDYWHNERVVDKNYHRYKTIACMNNDIRLIHIFEHEWDNEDKKNKIISIIKSALGMEREKVVYGRDTEAKEVTSDLSNEFLEKNHLQGRCNSKINIALYADDNIVGIMTFGTSRFDKENEYELIRLAFDKDTAVVGGAQKLFKYFINKYNPSNIVTYCDISKFSGKVYEELGFKLESYTEPNYIWYNENNKQIYTRYQTMRHKLKERFNLDDEYDDMTEDSIMKSLGFLKIYDCGNAKYLFERT